MKQFVLAMAVCLACSSTPAQTRKDQKIKLDTSEIEQLRDAEQVVLDANHALESLKTQLIENHRGSCTLVAGDKETVYFSIDDDGVWISAIVVFGSGFYTEGDGQGQSWSIQH